MLGGVARQHGVEHPIELQVLRHRHAEHLLRLLRATERRQHVHHVHHAHDEREQHGQRDESHASCQANGHGKEHAANVLRAARDAAEAHQVEHAHDGDTRTKIAVDQGDHHLHDERQQRQGHHEVLRILVAEHVDAGHGRAEHDGRGAAHQKLHGGHARHQGIGRSENRGEGGIKHNDHPFGRSGTGKHREQNGRRRRVRTPDRRRRTC